MNSRRDIYADQVIIHANIYTVNSAKPWAEALAIKDGRISCVGNDFDIQKWIGPKTEKIDLKGKLVLPGLIDSHIHPGLVGLSSEVTLIPFTEKYPLPYTSKDDILKWLRKYVKRNPNAPVIVGASWRQEDFGIEGPNKKELDDIVGDRPVLLVERWGHGCWMNSKTLEMMGVDRDTKDAVPALSYFQRDENGDPTGWAKEGMGWNILFQLLSVGKKAEIMFSALMHYLSAHGITTLYDAGNMTVPDKLYPLISKLDRAGRLNMRFEACYHIILPYQMDIAVSEIKRLRKTYGSKNLQFNSVKIHFDGLHTNNTGALMEPYTNRPETNGATLFSEDRMVEFILELNKEKIDLHVHCWGDRSAHIMLNAYERATDIIDEKLYTRLTLTHLPLLLDEDIKRFKKLGVVANFTPSWSGDVSNEFFEPYFGKRTSKLFRIKPLLSEGVPVSFSSDIISAAWIDWANPFYSMQVAHNRQAVKLGKDAPVLQPDTENLSLEELVHGYTLAGAYQLRMDNNVGSIESGKMADLTVLNKNLFEMNEYDIHNIKVEMTMLGGKTIYRRNLKNVLYDKIFDGFLAFYLR